MYNQHMSFIIIGSVAAKHWFPEWRTPKDIDLLTSVKITSANPSACAVDTMWHEMAEELIDRSVNKTFLDADLLFTLKLSHSFWDIHWQKTVFDICTFQRLGVEYDKDLHSRLVIMWTGIHGAKRVNMNQHVDKFFQDSVDRQFDHEQLHEILAFNDTPMHVKMRQDPSNAMLKLSDTQRFDQAALIELALEEIMVVAVERFGARATSKSSELLQALHKAHKQLAISMTKGWFAEFLILQRYTLLHTKSAQCISHMRTRLINLDLVLPAP